MGQKHYTLGAGQVGCLYDYGPNNFETLEDALEDATWYAEMDVCGQLPEEAKGVAHIKSHMVSDLRTKGIYYFPASVRPLLGDYIEVSEHDGPCQERDD
jgi:hypothetical protein